MCLHSDVVMNCTKFLDIYSAVIPNFVNAISFEYLLLIAKNQRNIVEID